jgi:hypothetical protein
VSGIMETFGVGVVEIALVFGIRAFGGEWGGFFWQISSRGKSGYGYGYGYGYDYGYVDGYEFQPWSFLDTSERPASFRTSGLG